MRQLLGVMVLFFMLPVVAEEPARQGLDLYRLDDNGVAIDGYSPVSYFQRGKAEKGSPDFAYTHQGITYWFTDAGQVERFKSDPQHYEPAHGGWCSLMMSGSAQRAVADPETFKIVDDRLLLFWSGNIKGQAINGLRNWNAKTRNDPEEERQRLAVSDKNWRRILAGKKKSKIVYFEPDKGR